MAVKQVVNYKNRKRVNESVVNDNTPKALKEKVVKAQEMLKEIAGSLGFVADEIYANYVNNHNDKTGEYALSGLDKCVDKVREYAEYSGRDVWNLQKVVDYLDSLGAKTEDMSAHDIAMQKLYGGQKTPREIDDEQRNADEMRKAVARHRLGIPFEPKQPEKKLTAFDLLNQPTPREIDERERAEREARLRAARQKLGLPQR